MKKSETYKYSNKMISQQYVVENKDYSIIMINYNWFALHIRNNKIFRIY